MGQFTDNGVIYEELPGGQVRVVGHAPAAQAGGMQGFVPISGADPSKAYEAPKAAADLARVRADLAATPVEIEGKRLANQKAQIEIEKLSREVKSGAVNPNDPKVKAAVAQLMKTEAAYASSIKGGLPNPIGGIFPTDANTAFNSLGSGLAEIGNAAFRVPGIGAQSDADAARFAAANQPTARDTEAAIEAKFSNMRTRLEANGVQLPAPNYAAPTGGAGGDRAAMLAAAGVPGNATPSAPPPGGMDRSTGAGTVMGPNGGGGPQSQFSGDSGFKTEEDPARAGLNARVNKMLQSGASDDQVRAFLSSTGLPGVLEAAEPALKARANGYKGAYSIDLQRQKIPLGGWDSMVNSLGTNPYAAPVAAYSANAADALTGGWLDNMSANPTNARAVQEGLRAQNPNASLAGMVTGGALAAGGLEMGLGALGARAGAGLAGRVLSSPLTADAAYGAAAGAGNADEGSRLAGAAIGAGAGALGGVVGRGAGRALGGMFAGVRNPDVQALRARGVPVTAGQVMGGVAKSLEDASTSIPLVGNMINARRMEGVEGFNRAALNEGVSPLARQSNPLAATITGTGEDGVEAMRLVNEQGYANALGGRTAMRDPAQMMDFDAARQAAGAIPNKGPEVLAELDGTVPGYFDNGMMTGENARAAVSELRGLRSSRKTDPLPKRTGDAIRGAENSILNMFDRQSPGFANDLAQANLVNGNLKTIEKATQVAGRQDGLFTPAQLDRASQVGAGKFGGNAATTARPFFDLSRAGQHVLPSALNDSGTATRAAVMAGLGLTGVGGAGYAAGGAQGAGTGTAGTLGLGAALALGGTKTGQKALVKLLTDRPDLAIRIGEQINRRAGIGGMFGAGAAASLLPSP